MSALAWYDYGMNRPSKKENSDNPATDVWLRRRSTPYEFAVFLIQTQKPLRVYHGKSHNYACSAYWQAVSTSRFFNASVTVNMEITKAGKPFGGFSTEIAAGRITSLHKASDNCREWITSHWLGKDVAEKLIATIPGTLGPSEKQL